MKYVTITVTPNPSNVILPNNYTYDVVITEELPTSYGSGTNRISLDSLAYDMSHTDLSMDDDYLTFDTSSVVMSQTNITMDEN